MTTRIDTLSEASEVIEVGRDEVLRYIIPIRSDGDTLIKREIILREPGARVEVFGILLGSGRGSTRVQVDTIHAAPNTTGRTEFRAVLRDQAQFDFFGMIKILPGAHQSQDFLQQDSLLLSEKARANTVPGLEIEADDVKASHGATVKPIDPEQLFYLESRGLRRQEAEQLLVQGFIAQMIEKMDNPEVEKMFHI